MSRQDAAQGKLSTREKLLETAIDLIWRSNYANVGVNEICSKAGVTKGGFYHYFETKADLFYEASLYHWNSFQPDLNEKFSPTYNALEQLENLFELVLTKQERHQHDDNPVSGCPFFTSGAQCGTGEEKVRQASKEMSDKAVKYNVLLVRNLQAEGYLGSDANPEIVGRLIHEFIQGVLTYGRVRRDINLVMADLREGVYRIVDLKAEYRAVLPKAAE